jgi:AraC family transcriptional regulator
MSNALPINVKYILKNTSCLSILSHTDFSKREIVSVKFSARRCGILGVMKNEQPLLELMARSLGEPPSSVALARASFQSHSHFQRTFLQTLGEPPGSLIRRLNLERAAHALRATEKSVIQIALESGYRSHEGFTRAFHRAFRLSPRDYRKAALHLRELPGASGLHFNPSGASPIKAKGNRKMDLTDRMIQSDLHAKRRLLECAKLLTDRQLDAPLAFRHTLTPFVEPARTLRESLERLVGSHWVDLMFTELGYIPQDAAYRTLTGSSPAELLARLESYHASLRAFVEHVREKNLWDKEWIDRECEEPHTFAIGQVIEETLTWDIAYRLMLERQLEGMGF